MLRTNDIADGASQGLSEHRQSEYERQEAPRHQSEYNDVAATALVHSCARRNSCALMATMTVLADISTAAKTVSMPSSAATASATALASPVSITTSIPCACRR